MTYTPATDYTKDCFKNADAIQAASVSSEGFARYDLTILKGGAKKYFYAHGVVMENATYTTIKQAKQAALSWYLQNRAKAYVKTL